MVIKPAYTIAQIQCAKRLIKALGLESNPRMLRASNGRLQAICNGVGAESWCGFVRNISSFWARSLTLSAMIHDFDYELSDASYQKQLEADLRFLSNGILEINHRYAWYNPLRYIARRKLMVCFDCLRGAGKSAWLDSYNTKHKTKLSDYKSI